MTEQMDQKAYAKALWDRLKQDAGNLSGVIGSGYDGKKLSLAEKLAIWNDRALSIEEEWELWRQGSTPERIAAGEKKLSPEEIGMKVFPKREQLYKSGGNVEPSMWIKEANHLAQEAEKQRRVADPMPADLMETEVPSDSRGMGEEIAAPAPAAPPERGY